MPCVRNTLNAYKVCAHELMTLCTWDLDYAELRQLVRAKHHVLSRVKWNKTCTLFENGEHCANIALRRPTVVISRRITLTH